MSDPFIMLARKFFRHWLWTERREFSRAEAWIDMITSATYEDEASFTEGGCLITLLRGEMRASVRELGTRWGWSRSKVERYLLLLKNERMIETRTSAGVSIVKLCNYKLYHPNRDTDEPRNGTLARHPRDTGETPPDGSPLCTPPSLAPSAEKKGKKSRPAVSDSFEVPYPPQLAGEDFEKAWSEWLEYRRQMKFKAYLPMGIQKMLTELSAIGKTRAIAAINHSIANGWQGIHEAKSVTRQANQSEPVRGRV